MDWLFGKMPSNKRQRLIVLNTSLKTISLLYTICLSSIFAQEILKNASSFGVVTEDVGHLQTSSKFGVTIEIVPFEHYINIYTDFLLKLEDILKDLHDYAHREKRGQEQTRDEEISYYSVMKTIQDIKQTFTSSTSHGDLKIIASLLMNGDANVMEILEKINYAADRVKRAISIIAGFVSIIPYVIQGIKYLAKAGITHLAKSPAVKSQVRKAITAAGKKLIMGATKKALKKGTTESLNAGRKELLKTKGKQVLKSVGKQGLTSAVKVAGRSLLKLTQKGMKNVIIGNMSNLAPANDDYSKTAIEMQVEGQITTTREEITGISKVEYAKKFVEEKTKYSDTLFHRIKQAIYDIQDNHVSTYVISTHDIRAALTTFGQSSSSLPENLVRSGSTPNLDLIPIEDKTYISIIIEIPLIDDDDTFKLFHLQSIPIFNRNGSPQTIKIQNPIVGIHENKNEILYFPSLELLDRVDAQTYIHTGPITRYSMKNIDSCELSILYRPSTIEFTCQIDHSMSITVPLFLKSDATTWLYITPKFLEFEYKKNPNMHCINEVSQMSLPQSSFGQITIPHGMSIVSKSVKINNFELGEDDATCAKVNVRSEVRSGDEMLLQISIVCTSALFLTCIAFLCVCIKLKLPKSDN